MSLEAGKAAITKRGCECKLLAELLATLGIFWQVHFLVAGFLRSSLHSHLRIKTVGCSCLRLRVVATRWHRSAESGNSTCSIRISGMFEISNQAFLVALSQASARDICSAERKWKIELSNCSTPLKNISALRAL